MKIAKISFIILCLYSGCLSAGIDEFKNFVKMYCDNFNLDGVKTFDEINNATLSLIFGQHISRQLLEAKFKLADELYESIKNISDNHNYKTIGLKFLEQILDSANLAQNKNRFENFLNNKDQSFVKYLADFNGIKSNLALKGVLLNFQLKNQIQIPLKPKANKVASEDLIATGLHAAQYGHSHKTPEEIPKDMLNTMIISSSYERAVAQGEKIESEQQVVNASIDELQGKLEDLAKMQDSFQALIKLYQDDLPEALKLGWQTSQNHIDGNKKIIQDSINKLNGYNYEIETKKHQNDFEKSKWGGRLQEKIDEKNTCQQLAEKTLRQIQRAEAEAKRQLDEIEKQSDSLKSSKRLLVRQNLEKGLTSGAFNPETYTANTQ